MVTLIDDLDRYMFLFLESQSLFNCILVNKRFNQLLSAPPFWKQKLGFDFPQYPFMISELEKGTEFFPFVENKRENWKKVYFLLIKCRNFFIRIKQDSKVPDERFFDQFENQILDLYLTPDIFSLYPWIYFTMTDILGPISHGLVFDFSIRNDYVTIFMWLANNFYRIENDQIEETEEDNSFPMNKILEHKSTEILISLFNELFSSEKLKIDSYIGEHVFHWDSEQDILIINEDLEYFVNDIFSYYSKSTRYFRDNQSYRIPFSESKFARLFNFLAEHNLFPNNDYFYSCKEKFVWQWLLDHNIYPDEKCSFLINMDPTTNFSVSPEKLEALDEMLARGWKPSKFPIEVLTTENLERITILENLGLFINQEELSQTLFNPNFPVKVGLYFLQKKEYLKYTDFQSSIEKFLGSHSNNRKNVELRIPIFDILIKNNLLSCKQLYEFALECCNVKIMDYLLTHPEYRECNYSSIVLEFVEKKDFTFQSIHQIGVLGKHNIPISKEQIDKFVMKFVSISTEESNTFIKHLINAGNKLREILTSYKSFELSSMSLEKLNLFLSLCQSKITPSIEKFISPYDKE